MKYSIHAGAASPAALTLLVVIMALSPGSCNQSTRVKDTKPRSDVTIAGAPSGKKDASPAGPGPVLPADMKREAQFKEAIELIKGEKAKEALPLLFELKGKMGALTDYHLYYTGKCCLMLDKPVKARQFLEPLGDLKGSRFRGEVPAMIAESHFLEEKYDQAAAEYAKEIKKASENDAKSAALSMMLALSYEKAQKPLKARKMYGEVIRKFPHREEAEDALEAYTRLAPDFVMPESWKVERIESLEMKRLFNEAYEEFNELKVPKGKEEKHKYLYKKASLLYKARKSYKEALKILMQLIGQKSKLSGRAILLAAKCKRRMGDIKGARVLFQLYLKRYPASKGKGEVLLSLLRFDVQEKRWVFITKNYAKFDTKTTFLSARQKRELLWILGFSNFLIGDPIKAGKIFTSLKKGAKDLMELMKVDYWYAVTLKQRGKKKGAAKIFKSIHQKNPLHYYSVLSLVRLGEMNEQASFPSVPEDETPAVHEDPCALLPENVQMLVRMGMSDEARAEITNQRNEILKNLASDPDKLLQIFHCSGAQDVLFRSLSGKYNKYTQYYPYKDIFSYWKILYPFYRMEEVNSLSEKYNVPVYLILSIIRQESRFDSGVTSYAGAMGLMQLMPKTARHIADKLGEPYDREAVYAPETNMRYGVYYLSTLIKKFNGNMALAVAAYNGGPHNVETWLKQKWTDRLDLFVELIPYVQTRNYIRRVTTSFTRYGYLYDGSIEPAVNILSQKTAAKFKKEPRF